MHLLKFIVKVNGNGININIQMFIIVFTRARKGNAYNESMCYQHAHISRPSQEFSAQAEG